MSLDERKVCPRCQTEHGVDDFRGSICGWCADDLEAIVGRPTVGYEPWLDEPERHHEETDDRQAG